MSQDLEYNNDSGSTGSAIQVDVAVEGIDDVLGASLVDAIVLSLSWTPQFDASFCEGYVIDPDGTQHTLFNYGQLPSGTSPRVDSITLTSGSYPTSGNGAWEFYLNDSYGGSNSVSDALVKFEVTDTLMPATYGESIWYNGKQYPAGIDLTNNQRHVYPDNGAAMVNDTAFGGVKAFEFDGTDDVYSDSANATLNGVATCSWSMWVKPASLANKGMIFCNHGYRKGNFQCYLSGSTVNLLLAYFDPAYTTPDGMRVYANSINTANQWYHIAMTFDGNEPVADRVRIWIDDQEETTTTTEYGSGTTTVPYNNIAGTGPPVAIGGLVDTSLGGNPSGTIRYPLDGRVDDCRVFPSYKLTTDDITWLSSGRGVAGGPPDFRAFYLQNQSPLGTV